MSDLEQYSKKKSSDCTIDRNWSSK